MNATIILKTAISNIINRMIGRYYRFKIMDTISTLEYIIENGCSLSRFGEGEIRMMKSQIDIGFQDADPLLIERLKHIIKSNTKCRIGLPYPLVDYQYMNERGKRFWSEHLSYAYLYYYKFMNHHTTYLDTQVSRFYIDRYDKSNCKSIVELWKRVWDERNVVLVEGKGTRLGYKNDLFSNAKSIKRIVCPSENAWDKYQQILAICLKSSIDSLFLIALGPTATVLAYDLTQYGFQALDIGHIDIEYEWYLLQVEVPVDIRHKYVNEVTGGSSVTDINDSSYDEQIIVDITEMAETGNNLHV